MFTFDPIRPRRVVDSTLSEDKVWVTTTDLRCLISDLIKNETGSLFLVGLERRIAQLATVAVEGEVFLGRPRDRNRLLIKIPT